MTSAASWLGRQRSLYGEDLPEREAAFAVHPVSGEWQRSDCLQSRFWWGGGASRETYAQLPEMVAPTQLAVASFGPVQTFLGGGQRLRDWAVGSWLCHYLAAVWIWRWERAGGHVLLPLHRDVPLLRWLRGEAEIDGDRFWQAELPNVLTGLLPDGTLAEVSAAVGEEWARFLQVLEKVCVEGDRDLLNGIGWRVIHRDHAHLWSVYREAGTFQAATLSTDIAHLYQRLESQKIGRNWQGAWWAGDTSPSAGSLSQWHPGLRPIDDGGIWGLPRADIDRWWEKTAERSRVAGLFSAGDRLNSIEMVKRLASAPHFIERVLERLWERKPPACPWETFPDRSAAAAAWVVDKVSPDSWNAPFLKEDLEAVFFQGKPKRWGMPRVDCAPKPYIHPRILERRNITKDDVEVWEEFAPKGWESPIEWTVGWRGDGDNMGKWLSGQQYEAQNLPWQNWHPNPEVLTRWNLDLPPPAVPPVGSRQLDLPHMLDLSVLFGYWNRLLYPLVQEHHNGRVIFAGGDDFLLLGPLTEAIALTTDLHKLWSGEASPLTQPLIPAVDGWVTYQGQVYPVPGRRMTFSLGVVVAQRRIPQSLWHRGLNQAYKAAKKAGRNRVCFVVLFNSGQSLNWTCPWPLWDLLMAAQPLETEKTELNRWEKLLGYLEQTNLRRNDVLAVRDLIDTLWQSIGLDLSWARVEAAAGGLRAFPEMASWDWWQGWVSLRGFLARQERDRQQWLQRIGGNP